MLIDYYLTGGRLTLGKKEFLLELLRDDSVLRRLLGFGAGELKGLAAKSANTKADGDLVILDFSYVPERKLVGDPGAMLKLLKQRYGKAVGGKLFFKSIYQTFQMMNHTEADLDADEVVLRLPDTPAP